MAKSLVMFPIAFTIAINSFIAVARLGFCCVDKLVVILTLNLIMKTLSTYRLRFDGPKSYFLIC